MHHSGKKKAKNAPKGNQPTPFAVRLWNAVQASVNRLLALKQQSDIAFLCGLVRSTRVPSSGPRNFTNWKRWESQPVRVPPTLLANSSFDHNRMRVFEKDLSYRPFPMRTTRLRTIKGTQGWRTGTGLIPGHSLQISVIHLYVDDDRVPVGVGIHVAGFKPGMNVELIFPVANEEHVDQDHVYDAFRRGSWSTVVQARPQACYLAPRGDACTYENPMAALELQQS